MNILLWVLQGLLAVHTLMGAIWKFKNPAEKTMPTLKAIPPKAWLGLSVFEIFLALGLIIPAFIPGMAYLISASAICIALVMVIFCVFHLASGSKVYSPMIYWGVVAILCLFIAYGRTVLHPL